MNNFKVGAMSWQQYFIIVRKANEKEEKLFY